MYRLSQDAQEAMQGVNQRVAQIINKSIQSEAVQNQIQQLNKMSEECLSRYSNRQLQIRTIMDAGLVHDQTMAVVRGNIQRVAQSANQRMWNQMNIQRHMASQNQQLTQTTNRLMAAVWETSQSAIEATQLSVQSVIEKHIESSRRLIELFEGAVSRRIDAEGRALINSYSWWLVPGLPEEFGLAFHTRLENKPSQEEIDQFYCDWFRENEFEYLTDLIDNWDSIYFEDRRELLEQALDDHKRGSYYASVPLLLIVFDGISVDYYMDAINPRHNPGSPKGVFQVWAEKYEGNLVTHALLRQIAHLLSEFVFVWASEKTPDGPPLNRNLTMHGRDKFYGTEANSVRCLMLLQSLHYFITHSDPLVN